VRVRLALADGTRTDLVATTIESGGSNVCAILEDRTVACWGRNWIGQNGTGAEGPVARLVRGVGGTGGLTDVVAITAGNVSWIAVRATDPRVVGWGAGEYAQLADGSTEIDGRYWPVASSRAPATFERIELGGWHGCALRADGGVSCWGRDDRAQVALAAQSEPVLEPTAVAALPPATSLAGHPFGMCAHAGDDVRCWGAIRLFGGASGGIPGCWCEHSPQTVPRPAGVAFRAIFGSPSTDTVFALGSDGNAWCWGANRGQLCTGELGDDAHVPTVHPELPEGIVSVAAGTGHACALAAGRVWCWGENPLGQVGTGTLSMLENTPRRITLPP
jgi:alpha-tubulin suppressor-like RCC1 family protein